jgi:hypothetical protein
MMCAVHRSCMYSWLITSLISLLVIIPAASLCLESSEPFVRCISQGALRGRRLHLSVNRSTTIESLHVDAFLGIPYGEPPLGEQRFRRSKPKQAWHRSLIYDARQFSHSCYQMIVDSLNATGERIWTPSTPMNEDCLYLNVWTPINSQQESLAVMVWIYGGGFTSGSVGPIAHCSSSIFVK